MDIKLLLFMDERLLPLIDYYIGHCMDLIPHDAEDYADAVYDMAKRMAENELYGDLGYYG